MRTMHLFAGIGGGLLADLILGHTPIVAVEWDKYACQVLRERAKDGWFPDLSVWEGDVRLFDPSEYAGKVDCIHAGFPCQDISVAGNRAGVGHETRSGLYREVLRIAGIVRPRYLFLENVSAILGNGLGTVLADLAAMGFSAEWGCIRASDCGAPHHRDRWFALCTHARHAESQGWIRASERLQRQGRGNAWSELASLCGNVSNADELGSAVGAQGEARGALRNRNRYGTQEEREWFELNARVGWRSSDVAESNGTQRQGNQCTKRIRQKYADLSRAGWWGFEPGLGRVANGVPNRIHRLKGLGNAQVPLQAAAAWRLLGGE